MSALKNKRGSAGSQDKPKAIKTSELPNSI
jgi:hypothetical protein